MIWLKNNWSILLIIILGGFLMRECGKSEPPKYIETIVPVEVSVPAITSSFPEVKDPVPVSTITETEIDSTYYFKIPRPPMIYFGADLVMANGNAEMSSSLAPGILFIPKNHKYAVKGNYDLANESFLLGAYYKF